MSISSQTSRLRAALGLVALTITATVVTTVAPAHAAIGVEQWVTDGGWRSRVVADADNVFAVIADGSSAFEVEKYEHASTTPVATQSYSDVCRLTCPGDLPSGIVDTVQDDTHIYVALSFFSAFDNERKIVRISKADLSVYEVSRSFGDSATQGTVITLTTDATNLYVGTNLGSLYTIPKADFTTATPTQYRSGAIASASHHDIEVAGGSLFVINWFDGTLIEVDLADMSIQSTLYSDGGGWASDSALAVDGDNLYYYRYTGGTGTLHKYSVSTGTELGTFDLGYVGFKQDIIVDDSGYVWASSSSTLQQIDWSVDASPTVIDSVALPAQLPYRAYTPGSFYLVGFSAGIYRITGLPAPPERATLVGWGRNDRLRLGIQDVYDPMSWGTVYNKPEALYDGADSALNGKSIVRVSAGGSTACALTSENEVVCWGNNSQYQYGNGEVAGSGPSYLAEPVKMDGALAGKTVVDIGVGSDHGCALTSDGLVYCWGVHNTNGASGRAGTGSTTATQYYNQPTAVDTSGVLNGETVEQLSVGGLNTCVLTASGKVACWGWNLYGSLGTDALTTSQTAHSPVLVNSEAWSGETVKQISAATVSGGCAVTTVGNLYCWGWNIGGALGSGVDYATLTQSPVPVAVDMTPLAAAGTVKYVTSGSGSSCALTSLGKIFCWGYGGVGGLGDGAATDSSIPVEADLTAMGAEKVVEITAMQSSYCARTDAFKVYCWGDNRDFNQPAGQLGDGSAVTSSPVPVAVATDTALAGKYVTRLSKGSYATYMLAIVQDSPPVVGGPVNLTSSPSTSTIAYGDTTPTFTPVGVDPSTGDEVDGAVTSGECTVYEAGTDTVVTDDPLLPGEYEVGCTGEPGDGFTIEEPVRGTLTVTKADLDCVVDDFSGEYDGNLYKASVTCTGYGTDSFSADAEPGHIDAGTYTDDWTISGTELYNEASGTATVEITPAVAALSVTAPSSLVIGRSLDPTATVSPEGLCDATLVTYSLDVDPTTGTAGEYELGAAPIDTRDWLAGTYSLTAHYPGEANCAESTDGPFELEVLPSSALTIAIVGDGSVASEAAGVDCSVDCTEYFAVGTSVTLTAVAAAGQLFTGWSGACSGTGDCTVSMSEDVSVTATFVEAVGVTVNVPAGGAVTVNGQRCTSTCTIQVPRDSSVTITAEPASGYSFSGWLGACSGTGTCVITASAALSLSADFVEMSIPATGSDIALAGWALLTIAAGAVLAVMSRRRRLA